MIHDLTNVVVDYNDDYAYIPKHQANRKHNPCYRIGRGRAKAFRALGNEVITGPQTSKPEQIAMSALEKSTL